MNDFFETYPRPFVLRPWEQNIQVATELIGRRHVAVTQNE